MTTLNGRHMTVYRYRRPVRFGDNRLMLRPRDTALHQGVDIALSLNEAELGHDLCYELGELAPPSPNFLADDLLGLGYIQEVARRLCSQQGGPCVRCCLAPAGSTHSVY